MTSPSSKGLHMSAAHVSASVSPGWRWMLLAAAAYNLVIGIPGLLATDADIMARTTSLLVSCFGILYALVGWRPAQLAPALWAGLLGKVGVVALILPDVLSGQAPAGTGAIIAGDALFGAAFLAFLITRLRA